jgi:uncharacterized protein YndB with AHSA1/START domain
MKTIYTVKEDNKTLVAERSFNAPLEKVWEAWTNAEFLDKWWGPLPYNAITHSYSFTEGGEWRYVMQGPEGDKHHCLNTYLTINPLKQFTAEDSFCNEDGSVNTDLPTNHWTVDFTHENGVTNITVTTRYASEADLETVTKMGMKEGFNTGLNQLEFLLS